MKRINCRLVNSLPLLTGITLLALCQPDNNPAQAWQGMVPGNNPTPRLHVTGRFLQDPNGKNVTLLGYMQPGSNWFNGRGKLYPNPKDYTDPTNVAPALNHYKAVVDILSDPRPRYSMKKGKTPVLQADETRLLLNSIDTSHVVGLRDRALVAVMIYSFARVSAVIHMRVEDFYPSGRKWMIRLHEKGGKFHQVLAHHNAHEYLHLYIEAAGITPDSKGPLFRTTQGASRVLTTNAMTRRDAHRMIKRRAAAANVSPQIGWHTLRATGITTYLRNGGTLDYAQKLACHESARTTGLYDRREEEVSLDEIERILI
jgi:integrase